MPERSRDWLRQAEADLQHARASCRLGDYEWACFAAHQAAEKSVKALYLKFHLDAWGHAVSLLLTGLPPDVGVPRGLVDKGKILDKHYIPARYPNGFEQGAPLDYYTAGEAETASQIAGEIVEFCKGHLG